MTTFKQLAKIVVVGLLSVSGQSFAEAPDRSGIVIIVHPDSELQELDEQTLKRLFRGQFETNHDPCAGQRPTRDTSQALHRGVRGKGLHRGLHRPRAAGVLALLGCSHLVGGERPSAEEG